MIISKFKFRDSRGTMLIDALVSALIVGIAVVALIQVFGKSSDLGDANVEYMLAQGLAQKQIEALKVQNKAYWDGKSLTTTYQNITPLISETSPVTLTGSKASFAIVNQAKKDSANAYIDITSTVSWTSVTKTGGSTSRTPHVNLVVRFDYPDT